MNRLVLKLYSICTSNEKYPGEQMTEILKTCTEEEICQFAEEMDITIELAFDKEDAIDTIVKCLKLKNDV